MQKLQSNLLNMVLSLTIIALVAAAALGGMYLLTKEPIEKAKQEKQTAAINSVLPQIDGIRLAEPEVQEGYTIHRAYVGDSLAGAAVETSSNGFGGVIRLMVGFDTEGNIVNYEVLEHAETPGLGSHMGVWFKTDKNQQSIIGKNPAATKLIVSKDGGDVDAITAATISSRAFLSAVQSAYDAFMKPDTWSGASSLQPNAATEAESTDSEEVAANTNDPDSNTESYE
ncbi:MAG: RnfABCDGE type electron transport complex subunit G [Bacteroidales bacterium]|nr:RnfABCDGE type electron transport complex subunit G [Bacteroidales bacterium]